MANRLDAVTCVQVSNEILTTTVESLRSYGRRGCEGLVLWLGRVAGTVAYIDHAIAPPQQSIRSEDGVGYFVEQSVLFALNRMLNEKGLRLIAQVHSHPTEAYHSATDDAYALVTTEGGFSLVVPYFARGTADLESWAHYRLLGGKWRSLSSGDVRHIFQHRAQQ